MCKIGGTRRRKRAGLGGRVSFHSHRQKREREAPWRTKHRLLAGGQWRRRWTSLVIAPHIQIGDLCLAPWSATGAGPAHSTSAAGPTRKGEKCRLCEARQTRVGSESRRPARLNAVLPTHPRPPWTSSDPPNPCQGTKVLQTNLAIHDK
ncbi:hypothetical protein BCV69DRAFT_280057 [Microstroma glucosiphilum]|uniref:Uncharacterized protein n=1 Tax=Pseudomicrostroma glucosiphilum TaxID=1684307 RepID=A0A316UG31_9BASI|nr:hypothetical protein BCV69DRAFT_280057 [Pseudomicrostroma glucosiphilum]PWN24160.1 hypothetical protein BCV69DRAFT_280057 [Pseudomicrostroma glucosiphilum]